MGEGRGFSAAAVDLYPRDIRRIGTRSEVYKTWMRALSADVSISRMVQASIMHTQRASTCEHLQDTERR